MVGSLVGAAMDLLWSTKSASFWNCRCAQYTSTSTNHQRLSGTASSRSTLSAKVLRRRLERAQTALRVVRVTAIVAESERSEAQQRQTK